MKRITYLYKIIVNCIVSKRRRYIYKKFIESKKEILEGVKNYIVKEKDIEVIAKLRELICNKCEHITYEDKGCTIEGTAPCCSLCGCCLAIKVRALSSECPEKKWTKIISEEEEVNITII